jgi:hypothetical protein
MANRVMRDSTTAADIPLQGTGIVAGYGNGAYKWSPADWARFPHVPHAVIDVIGSDWQACSVLDVETGDAKPQAATAWVKARNNYRAKSATVYCNRSTIEAVDAACEGESVMYWVATLDGTIVQGKTPGGNPIVACQYKGQAQTGGHYDESLVFDAAWHPAEERPEPSGGGTPPKPVVHPNATIVSELAKLGIVIPSQLVTAAGRGGLRKDGARTGGPVREGARPAAAHLTGGCTSHRDASGRARPGAPSPGWLLRVAQGGPRAAICRASDACSSGGATGNLVEQQCPDVGTR